MEKLRVKFAFLCVCMLLALSAPVLAQLKLGFAVDMPSPSWRAKTAMTVAKGQAAIVTGDDGLIHVMGGYAGSDPPNATVEAYDPLMDAWFTKAPMLNATRGAAVAKGPDGIIYVIGGGNGTNYLATVQAYNTMLDTWSLKASMPLGVWMAGAATGNDGKIYVFGGESAIGALFSNRTQVYDPLTDAWTNGTDMPSARGLLGVVKGPDGLIYCMGGYNGSVLSMVEAYDPSTDTWTEKAPMPLPRLQFGFVLGPDDRIYAIGGGTSYVNNVEPFFDSVEIYDTKRDAWTTPSWAESFLPTARKELGAALGDNGRIYAIGGANGTYLNATEEALIVLPENVHPTAYIDLITPNPATRGEAISFFGHGSDIDGTVAAYKWRSSVNGTIGTSATLSLSTLADGTHTIYFSVKDDLGAWSEEVTAIVVVNKPITEDPVYQELLSLNDTLSDRIDGLSNKVDALEQQNKNLTDNVNSLTRKVDLMTLGLSGASVVIVVLLFTPIVLSYVRKRQSAGG